MSPEASPPKRSWLPRWLARSLKVVAWSVIFLAVLLNAFREVENWRGERAWTACQRDLRGRGENLSWEAAVPPPIPDGQNLAMAPLFSRELNYGPDPKSGAYTFRPPVNSPGGLKNMPLGGTRPAYISLSGAEIVRRTDLPGFARYFRENKDFPHVDQPGSPEEDILKALSRYDPALDELRREAAARPLTRFPLDWYRGNIAGMSLAHYNLQQGLVSTLRLRAAARLSAGREEEALSDLELGWRLCRDAGRDSLLIGALEEETMLRLTLGTVWDGLAERRWSAASLRRIQDALQPFQPLAAYPAVIRRERLFALKMAEFLQKRGDAWLLYDPYSRADLRLSTGERWGLWFVDGLVPAGWYDLNKALQASWMQEYLLASVDPAAHRVFPEKLARGIEQINRLPKRPTNVFVKFSVGVFSTTFQHAARIQGTLDQAVLACALERFFVDHGAYPLKLDELVPDYAAAVPGDVIGGGPLHYHPTPDGRFQIYAVGWNGKDEGGRVAWGGPGRLDRERGDWVWQYSEPDPPSPAK